MKEGVRTAHCAPGKANKESFQLTVYGDGNGLRQGEAVLAEEGGDLAEGVGLEVLNGGLLRVGSDDLEVEVVGLRNRHDGSGAGVVLKLELEAAQKQVYGSSGGELTEPLVKSLPKAILSDCSKNWTKSMER